MVIIKKKGEEREIKLFANEKQQLKAELCEIYKAGGRNILVAYNKNLSCFLTVYDDDKNKIGKIVGNSAILLSEILGKSEDNVFMTVPISIMHIIEEYLD